jgi:hypothetical protein
MEKTGSVIFVMAILTLTFGVGMVIIATNIKPITTTQTVTITQTVTQTQTAQYSYTCQNALLNGTIWEYTYQSNMDVSASVYANGKLIAQISCVPN